MLASHVLVSDSHYRTSARPKFGTAASPDLIPANPLASSGSVRFPLDEAADARNSRCRHLRGQHDDHEIR
jgi:hypothetical protein